MELFRVHAYTVDPSRTTEADAQPAGGAISITQRLIDALDRNCAAAKFDERALVDFSVDQQTRTNEVRDAVIQYAFSDGTEASIAASVLARRLSEAMDLRSKPSLFVLTSLRDGDQRQVILWTFPRDTAFQFVSGRDGPALDVLTDVFSQTSSLRKAALFEGRNLRNAFLTGRVLDLQSSHASVDVAGFWIERFLMCTFGLAGDAGTRLLADAFRDSVDAVEDPSSKEQLFAAIVSLRNTPRRRWSLLEIANTYLEGVTRDAFLAAIPNPETRVSTFELRRDVLDATLRFRIFALDTGVFVSSPLGEIGRSVSIGGAEERRLACKGLIVDEKVRTRHA